MTSMVALSATLAEASPLPAVGGSPPRRHRRPRTAQSNDALVRRAFIGLARMGCALVANLIQAGHDLTLLNRSSG